MVVIRLSRAGAKKRPFYHMVVTDSRQRRDSNYVEELGYFNPVARGQEKRLHLNLEKINYWQGVGAQLSDRANALIKEFKKIAPAITAETEKKEVEPKVTQVKKTVKKAVEPKVAEAKKTVKKTVKKTAEK